MMYGAESVGVATKKGKYLPRSVPRHPLINQPYLMSPKLIKSPLRLVIVKRSGSCGSQATTVYFEAIDGEAIQDLYEDLLGL